MELIFICIQLNNRYNLLLSYYIAISRLTSFLANGDNITMAGNAIDHAIIHALSHSITAKPDAPKFINVTVPETKHDIIAEMMN